MNAKIYNELSAPISDLNKGKAAEIFKIAKTQGPVKIYKNSRLAGVVISVKYYNELSEATENYYLMNLAKKRLSKKNIQNASDAEDVYKRLGFTREEIDSAEDIEIE